MAATLNRQRASGSGAQGGGGGYVIENSCRFNSADSPYLVRTWDTPTDANVWTFSTWIKRSKITTDQNIFGAMTGNGTLRWLAAGGLSFYIDNAAQTLNRITTQLFRDPLAWYHLVIAVETDLSSPILDRMIISVNGVRITSFTSSNSQSGTGFAINKASVAHRIGYSNYTAAYGDYYLAETVFVDGQQLDPTSFGEYDSNGNWVPIDPSELTFGNNGFHLKFDNANALGKDSSINDKSTTAYRYLRLDNTANQGSGSVSIGEWQLFEADGTEHPSSNMTSNSAPSPLVASASTANASYAAYGAFSGTNTGAANTGWIATSAAGYLQIDLGAGNEIVLDNYSITEGAGTATDNGPKTWTIEGSNTGDFTGEEEVLDTIVDEPIFSANEVRNFPMLGSGNHFSTSGISANDQVSDSPTDDVELLVGNYATWNALGIDNGTLSDGNLVAVGAGTYGNSYSTIPITAGMKVHVELTATNYDGNMSCGLRTLGYETLYQIGSAAGEFGWQLMSGNTSTYYNGSTSVGSMTALTAGKRVTLEIDKDAGDVFVWLDGVAENSGSSVITSTAKTALANADAVDICVSYYQAAGTNKWSANFGQLGFTDTPSTGYTGLLTAALPAPAIKDPSAYFQTKLFTGNGTAIGSGGDAVVFGENSTMQPDLVWIKDRDATSQNVFTDSVRGVTKELVGEDATAETTVAEGLNSFNADGFTLGNDAAYNTSSSPQVAWSWKKGAVPGFGINSGISHTKSTPTNIAHDLGAVPEFAMVKATSTTGGWYVYHQNLTSKVNNHCFLDTTAGIVALTDAWGVHTSTNLIIDELPSATYVAYSWVGIDGFSKFGTHEGNGAADGTFVYLGFRPAYMLFFSLDGTNNKQVFDNERLGYNVVNKAMNIDAGTGEEGGTEMDILSNGFKLRAALDPNIAETYIWAAFAEHPFGGSGVSQARAR